MLTPVGVTSVVLRRQTVDARGRPPPGFYQLCTPLDLLRQTAILSRLVSDKTPRVTATIHNLYPHAVEELLRYSIFLNQVFERNYLSYRIFAKPHILFISGHYCPGGNC